MDQAQGRLSRAKLEEFPAHPRPRAKLRVRADAPDAVQRLAQQLARCLGRLGRSRVVVLCIGTDRSTGDALGPLVGTLLMRGEVGRLPQVSVLGTLDKPVDTRNLERVIMALSDSPSTAAVVAVDACLGRSENVGTISVGMGPLQPAAWDDKKFPPVGDVFVMGTVDENPYGFLPHFVLQSTPLGLVLRMAEVIAGGLSDGIRAFLASQGSDG